MIIYILHPRTYCIWNINRNYLNQGCIFLVGKPPRDRSCNRLEQRLLYIDLRYIPVLDHSRNERSRMFLPTACTIHHDKVRFLYRIHPYILKNLLLVFRLNCASHVNIDETVCSQIGTKASWSFQTFRISRKFPPWNCVLQKFRKCRLNKFWWRI